MMKNLTTFAVATLVLILQPGVTPPPEAHAQVVDRNERRCRASLARGTRRYFDQTMGARQSCERRRLQNRIPESVDCFAPSLEMEDPRAAETLQRADTRLAQMIADGCTGVDLSNLGFPGVCGLPPDGSFDTNDLTACTITQTADVVAVLLEIDFPTFDGFITKSADRCVKAVNERGRRLVKRELRARHECLLDQEKGRFLPREIDCREPIPPYGSGTDIDRTDSSIAAAYRSLLTKIPASCATANVRDLYGGNGCADSTGGSFNTFDLQVCVFDSHRAADPPLMELSFPSPPDCGNGFVEGEEECDNGDANADDGPCLPDCTLAACLDGNVCSASGCTTGPSGGAEQCDDGNQIDTDACRNNCADAVCGDSVVCTGAGCTTGPGGGVEQCDTGATNDEGPCLSTCATAICGDGEECRDIECTTGPDGGPEACDDGGESADCNEDCSPSLCGDSILNTSDGEECDDGFILEPEPNECRPDCTLPACGDNVIDDQFGEQCDPPVEGRCDDQCQILAGANCGDGEVNGSCTDNVTIICTSNAECQGQGAGTCDLEQCDDGAGNSDTTPNACRTNCMLPECGDDVIDDQFGEACDDGAANATNAPCLLTCAIAVCSDSTVCDAATCTSGPGGGPEQCDDGAGNSDTTPDACRTNCADARCGDGQQDTGEQCDDGGNNSDSAPDSCRTDCTLFRCGDDVIDSGEECDNGADNGDDAACLSNCSDAFCGDGLTCSAGDCTTGPGGGPEGCDDASANGDDQPCRDGCAAATCGDGVICSAPTCTTGPGAGPERCDEGGANGDECTNDCDCGEGATVTGCLELQCPDRGRLTLFAGVTGAECTNNGDCPVPASAGGFCDTDLGRCRTRTKLDTGWIGIGHNADITDQVRTAGNLSCAGPFDPDSDEPCGECAITGLRPEFGNCRCNNNIRNVCSEPFQQQDADSCTVFGPTCGTDADCRRCDFSKEVGCAEDSDCPLHCSETNQACTDASDCPGRCSVNTTRKCFADEECPCFENESCPVQETCTLGIESCGATCTPGSCDAGSGQCIPFCETDADCRRCSGDVDISCFTDDQCIAAGAGFCMNGLSLSSCVDNQCVGACNCYFGPPLPLSAANVPVCIVNRFAEDVFGTANVDKGEGVITARLRSVVYSGELITIPCPVCGGTCDAPAANAGDPCFFDQDCDEAVGDGVCANYDPQAGDGVRGGTCVRGLAPGLSCDVDAFNGSFPFPGGGGHSLDCPPLTGKNVSGQGLKINLEQTTGTVRLDANIRCGFPGLPLPAEFCPCGVCGPEGTEPCQSNADCSSGVVCQLRNQGSPRANQCDGSGGICEVDPAGAGEDGRCASPNDVFLFCDGALRADGSPFVACGGGGGDAACRAADCSPGDCGLCTISVRKNCFLDPVVGGGKPDPEFPLGGTAFCIGPTTNPGINDAAGLPGPGRVVTQAQSTLFCASDPSVQYIPGVGGCPEEAVE